MAVRKTDLTVSAEAPGALLAVFDAKGKTLDWTEAFARQFAGASDDLSGRSIFDWVPELGLEHWAQIWRELHTRSGEAVSVDLPKSDEVPATHLHVRRLVASGEPLAAVEVRVADVQNDVAALRALQHDVLEGVATGRPLRDIMDLLCRRVEALVPSVVCSVLAIDQRGRLLHLASPSLPPHYSGAIDGVAIGPTVGSCGTAAYRGEAVEVTDIATDPLWADYKHLALPLGLRACWSSPIKSSTGRVIGTFAFYYRVARGPTRFEHQVVAACLHHCAIAIEHEEARSKIHQLAFCDTLTGLPNRKSFHDRGTELLRLCGESSASLAIHYVDLDDFKGVNDALGHSVGDRLLECVAERLSAFATDGAVVARLGGDEFALIQTQIAHPEEINELAARITAAFDLPFTIENHIIRISATVGIARVPDDGTDLVDLLRKADLALYRAKSEGRSRFRFFTAEMDAELQKRRTLEHDLRVALDEDVLELHYQPIIEISSGNLVAFEALLRWNHPRLGTIAPAQFIPLAEETGLIERIGDWVLTEALRQASSWPSDVKVAVNLSSRQFRNAGFVLDLLRALNKSGLSPSRVELEITESVLLADNAIVATSLRQLSDTGIQIALDDFGTGYSSLSYLRSFPIKKIKIDKSFIHDFDRRPESLAIVRAIVALARDLGMRTTAEGIETWEHLRLLRLEGCTEGQGFYLSRPLPSAMIPELLHRFHGETGTPLAASG